MSSYSVLKMIVVILVCFCFTFFGSEGKEILHPTHKDLPQDRVVKGFFSELKKSKKSLLDVYDQPIKTETRKRDIARNISKVEEEVNAANDTFEISEVIQDFLRAGILKNFAPMQTTTYRYPTAVWSSITHEKLKNKHKHSTKVSSTRPPLNFTYVNVTKDNIIKCGKQKGSRGEKKWKNADTSESISNVNKDDKVKSKSSFINKFLEQSLAKYLVSSNLQSTLGNVSVKTFSEILKNITNPKPQKFLSPYDENKEFRMKFRKEVIMKKKNETKPQEKFLQKQLQKRLEKVQGVSNEKNKNKILSNMWKYSTLNKTMEEKNNISGIITAVETTTFPVLNDTPIHTFMSTSNRTEEIIYKKNNTENVDHHVYDRKKAFKNGLMNFKLTAEETSYYKNRQVPSFKFSGRPDKPRGIPGIPHIDYPVLSIPPPTKFKCPEIKKGKPKMMADRETKCQVFYICTGDGPTTAMLCPNGTMFNENFMVCDWWYNVHC